MQLGFSSNGATFDLLSSKGLASELASCAGLAALYLLYSSWFTIMSTFYVSVTVHIGPANVLPP